MSQKSTIEWTDGTWNPVRGCTKISTGCKNCYAETFAERWRGIPGHPYEQGFDLRLVPEALTNPLRWKKPLRIFVNSMSDLFHKDVPHDYILRCYQVMMQAERHVFQILTKRADRMAQFLSSRDFERMAKDYRKTSHLWHGFSTENQTMVEQRIPYFDEFPTWLEGINFLSIEPMLGPVDFTRLPSGWARSGAGGVDWVICGGESGHNHRMMSVGWARMLRDQCRDAGVKFFMKQMGGAVDKRGALEDLPDDLRIREFPR